MVKYKTIENLLYSIDLTICNIPRNIKVLKNSNNLIDYIEYDFTILDYKLELLIKVLNKELEKI
jgi:hypothetical protein